MGTPKMTEKVQIQPGWLFSPSPHCANVLGKFMCLDKEGGGAGRKGVSSDLLLHDKRREQKEP